MNVTNVRVNLMLHGGNRVRLEKTNSKHVVAHISQQKFRRTWETLELPSL